MSALLINGSQQVLYDPAGTFTHPDLPRRGDIHYGMTPRYVDYYERYHARFDYFVEAQKVPISRAAGRPAHRQRPGRGQGAEDATARWRWPTCCGRCRPSRTCPTATSPRRCAPTSRRCPASRTSYVYETDVGKNQAWERSEAPPP